MTEDHRPDTEQISALAGGELDAAGAAAVRSAIDTDEELRTEYESLLATASLLATTPTARAPRNYSASLRPVSIAPWWMRWSPTLLATAAVTLIAFALIDLQGPRLARADPSSVVTELEIALAVASPSDSIETAGSAPIAAASSARPGTPAEAAEAPPSEIEVAVEAEAQTALAAPAPASRKAEGTESSVEPEVSPAAAAPDEAPAVEVMTVAESSPAEAADATIAADFGEDEAVPDAPIAAAVAESTDPIASSPESVAVPPPVMPDPGLEFDPVWLATLAAGGALLFAAGFAYVFRPR
jgi:hypothetical protein